MHVTCPILVRCKRLDRVIHISRTQTSSYHFHAAIQCWAFSVGSYTTFQWIFTSRAEPYVVEHMQVQVLSSCLGLVSNNFDVLYIRQIRQLGSGKC